MFSCYRLFTILMLVFFSQLSIADGQKEEAPTVLLVLTAESGYIHKNAGQLYLTLSNVAPKTLWFTEKPMRKAGYINTERFASMWSDDFTNSSPNAAITHQAIATSSKGMQHPRAIELKGLKPLENNTLRFAINELADEHLHQGHLKDITIFIDNASYSSLLTSTTVNPEDIPQTSRFRVTNQCKQTIWVQQDFKHTTQDPVVVKINPGMAYDYNIPDIGLTSTRFWPKTGCNEHGYQCKLGETRAVPAAEEKGWQKPPYAPDINSKFEATWGCLNSIFNHSPSLCASNPSDPGRTINNETWWNGSAVDGYTLPYAVNVYNHNNTCFDLHSNKVLTDPGVNCAGLKASMCPTHANLSTEGKYNQINGVDMTRINLQWLDAETEAPIGCFSPCAKLTTAQGSDDGSRAGGWKNILGLTPESPQAQMYCCPTPPVSSGECSAGPAARSAYSQSIVNQGCNAYTYAYDDAKGLAKCGSQTQFELVFCPSSTTPTIDYVNMTVQFDAERNIDFNGSKLTNNQTIKVKQGSELTSDGKHCVLSLNSQKQVSVANGELCNDVHVNNETKIIKLSGIAPPSSSTKVQVNYNTAFGITAFLGQQAVANAQAVNADDFSNPLTLTAIQQNKTGTCELTKTNDSYERGVGELCHRLNIVKDTAKDLVHIYLPADIPDMGGSTPQPQVLSLIFGMDSSIYVKINNQVLMNGGKVELGAHDNLQRVTLTAHQGQKVATCDLEFVNSTLRTISSSGKLCDSGLSIVKRNNMEYYIGLPNTLPDNDTVGGDKVTMNLGIAHGMRIVNGTQTIHWNSPTPTTQLKQGPNVLSIYGNNGTVRQCTININGNSAQPNQTGGCAGVVVHGNVIYFPYF